VSIDVLVDLCPELIVGLRPMCDHQADGLTALKHLGNVGRGLEIPELNVSVGVIQLEEGVPVAHVQQFGAPTEDLHVVLRHRRSPPLGFALDRLRA
jgi:hypothetical protein